MPTLALGPTEKEGKMSEKDLTLKEIRELKSNMVRRLELIILGELNQFEDETGINITEIKAQRFVPEECGSPCYTHKKEVFITCKPSEMWI